MRSGQRSVAGDMADDGQLLAVLLPEEGRIGPHIVEQALHHVHHPLEMAGSDGPFQYLIQAAQVVAAGA